METIAESLAKVWFLGVAVVGIAAYAVTLKVRLLEEREKMGKR